MAGRVAEAWGKSREARLCCGQQIGEVQERVVHGRDVLVTEGKRPCTSGCLRAGRSKGAPSWRRNRLACWAYGSRPWKQARCWSWVSGMLAVVVLGLGLMACTGPGY